MSKIAPEIVEINPFLSSFEIHCYYRTSESGPTEQTAKSVTFTLTEVDAKVSVYQKHLMAVVKQMTGSSPLLFFYLLSHIGWESEKIELKEDKLCASCGFSPATCRRAIAELKTLSILVRAKRKDTYWINPALFFRGSRLECFPDNIVAPEKRPEKPKL